MVNIISFYVLFIKLYFIFYKGKVFWSHQQRTFYELPSLHPDAEVLMPSKPAENALLIKLNHNLVRSQSDRFKHLKKGKYK